MNTLQASIMTFLKYVLWTAVAAGITAAIDTLATLKIPPYVTLLLAALLKTAATAVQTKINGGIKPEVVR